MAVRGRAVHKKKNPTLYIYRVIVMDSCPGHILESTKDIEIKLVKNVKERKCRIQEPQLYRTFYVSNFSLILFIKGVFFVMSWCTSSI